MAIVDDLVAHVDGRAELLQRQLDDLDRPVDAGAKAAGSRQQDVQTGRGGWSGGLGLGLAMELPAGGSLVSSAPGGGAWSAAFLVLDFRFAGR